LGRWSIKIFIPNNKKSKCGEIWRIQLHNIVCKKQIIPMKTNCLTTTHE
jgi:hypothetical protein